MKPRLVFERFTFWDPEMSEEDADAFLAEHRTLDEFKAACDALTQEKMRPIRAALDDVFAALQKVPGFRGER